ncbi:MAG: NAD-dependent epimerase/dehydratase family protein [Proteobacteria bacterium]|nr:NAD-dependent epimerase/dehydratase family protein [Pseudomonadota bacterium]
MPNYKHILITGGAGFVGSNLALSWAADTNSKITCLDNLHRRGSEFSLPRLKERGINFIHGDIRNQSDINSVGQFDLLIECSAEASVHAGYNTSPRYLIDTNLMGTVNCLEAARQYNSDIIYLSTSRVYPIEKLRKLPLERNNDRLIISPDSKGIGWSEKGISTDFSTDGSRSIYGATKLCSELLIEEYRSMYGLRCIVNRCGVISGPWQMGKVDQGFMSLWVARHFYTQKALTYMGFEGEGLQVRDVLHVQDLYDLIRIQTTKFDDLDTFVFNVGGGSKCSVSLKELTALCQEVSGNKIEIKNDIKTRDADIPWYITDNSNVEKITGWYATRTVNQVVEDIFHWIKENSSDLSHILN